MTDRELADAIRQHFGCDDEEIYDPVVQLLEDVAPKPPPTIDQMPGWTVGWHNGKRYALNPDEMIYWDYDWESINRRGVDYAWPDPPKYQEGDPIDILFRGEWLHENRRCIGVTPSGRIMYERAENTGVGILRPHEVRPHVEGTP